MLYSSVNDNFEHIAVQLQPNDRFRNWLLLYSLRKFNTEDDWKKRTKVMTVATQLAQKWCYSSTVYQMMCCAVQRLIAVLPFGINFST